MKASNAPLRNSICSVLFAAGSLQAATISWTASPGRLDTEVSAAGTQVFGYYWGASTPTVLVNRVPFVLQITTAEPPGLRFNRSYDTLETAYDLYRVPLTAGNAGLNQILDGQVWGSEMPLPLTGLVSGGQYLVQFMISDDRPMYANLRNYDISDGNDPEGARDIERAYHSTVGAGLSPTAPAGSIEGKIFTGTFTASASGTQDIRNWLYNTIDHTIPDVGSQVNAIQLRAIPEPTTFALAAGAASLYGFRRRRLSERGQDQDYLGAT